MTRDGIDATLRKERCSVIWVVLSTGILLLSANSSSASVLLPEDASFHGAAGSDWLSSVSSALGDVNGDGLDDFLLGANGDEEHGENTGQVYLFYGKEDDWHLGTGVNDADASFYGNPLDGLGEYLQNHGGDLDSDGLDDIVLASSYNDEAAANAGKIWVFFGRVDGWSMDTPVSEADASFVGESAWSRAGYSVSVGDVNGDGFDDLLTGAHWFDNERGKAYVVLGNHSGWVQDVDLGLSDISLLGENVSDWAGKVASGGDADGDGVDDILVGAPQHVRFGSEVGKAYWRPGRTSGWEIEASLADSDAAPASFVGEMDGDLAAWSVGFCGDTNGDDLDDILVGASWNDQAGEGAGKVYLVFGRTVGWARNVSLGSVDASFLGATESDGAGRLAFGLGDVDADGLDDMAIAATLADTFEDSSGGVYIVLGATGGWMTDVSLAEADGYLPNRSSGEWLGWGLGAAGDVNGDGFADLLAGAPYNDEGGQNAGKVSIALGGDCFEDTDGDRYSSCQDCNEADPSVHPDAPEQCNGVDDDCDGSIDDESLDEDGDGYTPCQGDCDDTSAEISPEGIETCDGLDNDCDGQVDNLDGDGDGSDVCDDCDDTDPDVFPGAPEQCNGVDDDCDGWATDEHADKDEDGLTPCEGDCDDRDESVHPGAAEICDDGVDNDCDGDVDAADDDCVPADDDSAADDDVGPDDDTEEPQDCGCRLSSSSASWVMPALVACLVWVFRSRVRW